MIESRIYDPSSLMNIEHENKYKKHPELYLKRQMVVEQRDFLKQIIYMLQGIQSQIFVKIYDEFQFDSEKGSVEKIFQFGLRKDSRIFFTHLTNQTLKTSSQISIKIANYLQYLTSKSRLIYKKTSNIFVKSFSQGIVQCVGRVNVEFTSLLTQIQKESGNLSNRNPLSTNQYLSSHQQNLTLLRISQVFQSKSFFISQLVNIVSKILPYVTPDSQNSPTDKYLVVQLLFNQFYRLSNIIQLTDKQRLQLQAIYQNCLTLYVNLIRDWVEMNPYVLESQKETPFFIKISQVNFSLSKSSSNIKRYAKLRSGPNPSVELKQRAYKNEEFVELFFKLSNIFVQEFIPQIFKKQGLCILELGKIIQFIYLYFSIEEKTILSKYFDVEMEFEPLFQLIKSNKNAKKMSVNKSMFIKQRCARKQRERISISERMAEKERKPLRFIQITQDNPYEMFPNTRGIFIDTQTANSSSSRKENKPLNEQNPVQSLAEIQIEEEKPFKINSAQAFTLKFQRVLSEIIQKLYQKTLYFFQQQSEKEFFRLESHLKIPSQSMILNSMQSIIEKRNSLPNIQSNRLASLTDHERIISSISLTLIGIKKFMLYQQGDFFLQLISIANTAFENSSAKVSRSLITSFIEEAIKSSSANDLPEDLKSKITFMFLKKAKDSQIRQLKVWSVFSIFYRPQFPVNCIFSNEIMTGFGQIFNFIFNIKQCEHSLKKIWDDFKQNAKITTQYSLFQIKKHPFQSRILAIRNNIHHFVNLIFGSIMIKIQQLWQQYIQEINISFLSNFPFSSQHLSKNKKIHNPISLIHLTEELLKNLKKQITQNLTLANTMILITQLIGKFKKLLKIQPDSKDWNDVIFGEQIGYIGHQFMGIMDMAKNIQGVGDSIFYNAEF